MVLIFEGCDKVGKSTLIDNFKKNTKYESGIIYPGTDWQIINYQYPTVCPKAAHDIGGQKATVREMMIEQLSSYTTSFKIFKKLRTQNIICDRFWVGEFVYCKIRKYSYPEMAERKWLKFFLNLTHDLDAFIVYVKADLPAIQRRMEGSTKKDYITYAEAAIIVSEYERVFSILKDMDEYIPNRFIEIDTTNRTKEQSLNLLLGELEKKGMK